MPTRRSTRNLRSRRRSPKRKSSKRKSPKRKSPKRKSPKRKISSSRKVSRMESPTDLAGYFDDVPTPWPLVTEAQRVLGKYGLVLKEISYMYEEYSRRGGDTHNYVGMIIGLMPNWRSNLMNTVISSIDTRAPGERGQRRANLIKILEELQNYDRSAYEGSQQLIEGQINAFEQHRMFSPHIANQRVADFLRLPENDLAPSELQIQIRSNATDIPIDRRRRQTEERRRWVIEGYDYLIEGLPRSSEKQLHHPSFDIDIDYYSQRDRDRGYLFKAIIKEIMTEADRQVLWNVMRYYHDELSRDSNWIEARTVRLS